MIAQARRESCQQACIAAGVPCKHRRVNEPRVAVVVGVGGGLGAAVARRFAREGHSVAAIARNRAALEPIAADIAAAGGRALPVAADATDPGAVAEAFAEVRRELGPPGVLVYNAGAFQVGGVLELSPDQFERAWKANCYGAFLAARALAQSLAREHGPDGVHVAHVVIDGQIAGGAPNRLSPDALATEYWNLHAQDPTTWTLELDLRPAVERF